MVTLAALLCGAPLRRRQVLGAGGLFVTDRVELYRNLQGREREIAAIYANAKGWNIFDLSKQRAI
jgi:hypothetical protein